MGSRIVAAAVAAAGLAAGAVAAPAQQEGAGAAQGAQAAQERTPSLTVRPRVAQAGGRIVLTGAGFAPRARVVLLAGPPDAEAARIGRARTDAEGRFMAPISIERGVAPGRYVALACRHQCRVKASAPFRVRRP